MPDPVKIGRFGSLSLHAGLSLGTAALFYDCRILWQPQKEGIDTLRGHRHVI